ERFAAGVACAAENVPQRFDLRLGETLSAGVVPGRAALQRTRIEAAGFEVVDHAVREAVERVALGRDGVRDGFELRVGERARQIGLAVGAEGRDARDGL